MLIAIIGADGFVGRAISAALFERGHEIVAIIRSKEITKLTNVKTIVHVDNADANQDWRHFLTGANVVLQLASPISVDKASYRQKKEYKKIIVDGTLAIASAAAESSVRRMIFISSVKVNGDTTEGKSFDEESMPFPKTCYGESKLEAETGLSVISEKQGMPITLIRPPVIYGPENDGNIYSLIKLLSWFPGFLLPFGNIKNKRSVLFIENLVSALIYCVEDNSRKSHLFLIRDPVMLSTSKLCQVILSALGKDIRLGLGFMGMAASVISFIMPGVSARLYKSLEIDDSAIFNALGWRAPFSTEEGLSKTISYMKRDRVD